MVAPASRRANRSRRSKRLRSQVKAESTCPVSGQQASPSTPDDVVNSESCAQRTIPAPDSADSSSSASDNHGGVATGSPSSSSSVGEIEGSASVLVELLDGVGVGVGVFEDCHGLNSSCNAGFAMESCDAGSPPAKDEAKIHSTNKDRQDKERFDKMLAEMEARRVRVEAELVLTAGRARKRVEQLSADLLREAAGRRDDRDRHAKEMAAMQDRLEALERALADLRARFADGVRRLPSAVGPPAAMRHHSGKTVRGDVRDSGEQIVDHDSFSFGDGLDFDVARCESGTDFTSSDGQPPRGESEKGHSPAEIVGERQDKVHDEQDYMGAAQPQDGEVGVAGKTSEALEPIKLEPLPPLITSDSFDGYKAPAPAVICPVSLGQRPLAFEGDVSRDTVTLPTLEVTSKGLCALAWPLQLISEGPAEQDTRDTRARTDSEDSGFGPVAVKAETKFGHELPQLQDIAAAVQDRPGWALQSCVQLLTDQASSQERTVLAEAPVLMEKCFTDLGIDSKNGQGLGTFVKPSALLGALAKGLGGSVRSGVRACTACVMSLRSAMGPLYFLKATLTRLDEIDCFRVRNAVFSSLRSPGQAASEQEMQSAQDFTHERHLADGTFGSVSIVRGKTESSEGTRYAMKAVDKDLVAARNFSTFILAEKETLMECDHPFIVKLYRTFQDVDKVYFLTEFVSGDDLWERLHGDSGGLSAAEVMFYSANIVEALSHMHGRGIAYRDLKLENLVIDAEGYLKVVDMGFAAKIATGGLSYAFVGTPAYVAPEIISRVGHDKTADLWSLGCIMFELASGRQMFSCAGLSKKELFSAICSVERYGLPIPDDFDSLSGSHALRDIIASVMDFSPQKRLGSASTGLKVIKDHVFFGLLDWEKLRAKCVPAPFVPDQPEICSPDHMNPFGAVDGMHPYLGDQDLFADF